MAKAPKKPGDRRGTPKGRATGVGRGRGGGGAIGNPKFVPTDEQRKLVIELIAGTPEAPGGAQHWFIAQELGISEETLRRHFRQELDTGTHQALALIGGSMMRRALDGDHDAQKFVLARRGGWKTSTELSGPNGGPIEYRELSDQEIETRISGLISRAAPAAKA